MTADLISRLEAAENGSRELDQEIALALGYTIKGIGYLNERTCFAPDGGEIGRIPVYTGSLDAVLKLVPEGWTWSVLFRPMVDNPPYRGSVADGHFGYVMGMEKAHATAVAKTPALALCIAALKAKAAQ